MYQVTDVLPLDYGGFILSFRSRGTWRAAGLTVKELGKEGINKDVCQQFDEYTLQH